MLNKLRSLGKQTFVYGLGSVLNKLLGFILIPMYQSYIPIGDFGYLIYFETIIIFLTAFINYGIIPAHQRFFYIEREKNTYGIFLFNNYFGCLVLSVITILPVLFFSDNIAAVICDGTSQSVILQITMWIAVTETMNGIPLHVLQYEQKPISFLVYNAIKLILTFLLTIYSVVYLSLGFEGIMYARLAGSAITMLFAFFIIILPRIKFRINLLSVVESVKFGFPYVVSIIGYTIFMVSDRFMLTWLSTEAELGKYGFGFKIANFINLIFVQTIGMSYFPSVMGNESQSDNIRYYRKMLTYYCFIIAFLVLFFLFFYKDILWIVGKNMEYWEGLKVVPLLSLSYMIMGMNYFVVVGLFLKNKTQKFVLPSFTAVGVNIAMNVILIPTTGMMGAAYSIVASQIVYTSLVAYLSGKYLKIKFEWGKVFLIYFFAIVLYILIQTISGNSIWIDGIYKFLALIIFLMILYKLNFFEKIEIQRVKEGLIKLKKRLNLKS